MKMWLLLPGEMTPPRHVSTCLLYILYPHFIFGRIFVWLVVVHVSVSCIQNCIVFHGKTAGSQVCGHNECLLYLSWTTFGSCTCTGEMGEPFLVCPEIERRGETSQWNLVQSSDTWAWDDTRKRTITGVQWHTSDN